jgi:hypothetical protein
VVVVVLCLAMPVRRGHVAPRTTIIETIIRKFDTHSELVAVLVWGFPYSRYGNGPTAPSVGRVGYIVTSSTSSFASLLNDIITQNA